MPACVAILYNPEDKRYLHLKNKKIKLPIFDIIVPLIADEEVDKDKGTGLVMCCTFGDFLDVTWQKKHNLPYLRASVFTSNIWQFWSGKWWSQITFWDAPYFQTNPPMWVPWICSSKFPGFQLFFLGTTINHPCFCHVSTRNDTPGPPPLLVQWYSPAAMARVFINPGAFEAREMGAIKTKYHRDMGYGVKMRI